MPELPPPLPSLRSTCGFDDPALAFPEFAAKKRCMLERVLEVEGEGEEDSSCGGRCSRLSTPSVSRNGFDNVETIRKFPSLLKESSLDLSAFREEEEEEEEEKRKWSGCFRTLCACTCMFISIALIVVLLIGFSVNSSINSTLPDVSITSLKFSRLDFAKPSMDLLMNSNLNTVLQLSNKNDKTTLYYTSMKADISSENINLGHKGLLGFNQTPGNITSLKIVTRIRKAKVYDVDATLLRNKEKKHEAVVNVLLSGKLGFDWLGFRIRFPIVIACEDVKQSDVMNGLKPICNVRIFSQ